MLKGEHSSLWQIQDKAMEHQLTYATTLLSAPRYRWMQTP